MFRPCVYSPTGQRADIKWPLQHPRQHCIRTMRNINCMRDVSFVRVFAHGATGRHKVAPTASAMLLLAHTCGMLIAGAMFLPCVYSPRMGLQAERCRGHFMSARTPERCNIICKGIYAPMRNINCIRDVSFVRVFVPQRGRRADIKWPLHHPELNINAS